MRAVIFGVVLLFVFTGCAIKSAVPKETYVMKVSFKKEELNGFQRNFDNKVIKVAVPKSTKEIMSEDILYMKDGSVNPYAYSRWSDTPNKLLQNLFLSAIEKSGLFRAAVPFGSRARSDFLLESTVEEFYQTFEGDEAYGRVKVRFYLIDIKRREVVAACELSSFKKAPTLDAKGGVSALSDASKEVALKLLKWLFGLKY